MQWNMKFCLTCLWKNVVMSQKVVWQKSFNAFFTSQETGCQWQITSAFAWYCLRWPWAACFATARAAVVSEGVFCAVAHARVCNRIVFCLVFGVGFNIMSALFVLQSPTLPQIIDSRAGLFWCKLGLVCECGKMNVYLKISPFTPDFGLFAAKWSAFCC